tara:strand:- start:2016 stop:2489 length:474 start_codon:yes stop_codon:yes gene_type:complete
MKNYILILVVAFSLASCASKSNFNSFYNENRNLSEFSISTPAFFANLFIPKEDVEGYEDLFKKVKHYKVMIYADETASLDKKFNRFIKRKKYTSVFRVNDNGSNIQFYFLENKNTIKEMVLKIKSDDSYVLLGLKTNISNNDLEKIIKNSNIKVSSN